MGVFGGIWGIEVVFCKDMGRFGVICEGFEVIWVYLGRYGAFRGDLVRYGGGWGHMGRSGG